jgi:hypothetical protein
VGEYNGSFSRERRRRTEKMRPAMADRDRSLVVGRWLVATDDQGLRKGLRKKLELLVNLGFPLIGPVCAIIGPVRELIYSVNLGE